MGHDLGPDRRSLGRAPDVEKRAESRELSDLLLPVVGGGERTDDEEGFSLLEGL